MKVLVATLLLMGLSPDDQAAQQLFKSLQERLEKARTFHAEFSVIVEAGGEVDWTLSGDVKPKGEDRWAIDLQYHGNPKPRQLT